MDGSQLLLKTDFAEARKGYDRSQVDEFLRALSEKVGELKQLVQQATRRAEDAEMQLAAETSRRRVAEDARSELEAALRASEQARAELSVSLDETRAKLDVDEVEVATGVLAMAKRTAEATVEEAVGRAQRLIEDAEVNAAVTQLEAEQRAERARREMEEEIETQRRQQLDALAQEVRALSAQRDALEADVVDLQDFLDEERRKLRDAIDELVQQLGDDGPLALGRQPVLTAPPVPAGEDTSEALPREVAGEAERRATQISHLLEGPDGSTAVPSAGEETVGEGSTESGLEESPVGATIDLTERSTVGEAPDDGIEDDTDPLAAVPTAPADDDVDGAIDAESSFGAPDPEAASAMREFFEGDASGEPPRGLRRFL